jgi:hypothetical protein
MASAAYQREWRKRNPDRTREYTRRARLNHKEAIDARKLDWARRNPLRVRAAYRKYKYGITQEQFEAMIKSQDGKCAICFNPFGDKVPRVDHDHATGKTRDLLCQFCNIALSLVEDPIRLASAIQYIDKHKQ